jgi:transglutaminase-like putative cysteine protease
MYSRKLKVISLITVLFFTWTLGGVYSLAAAATSQMKNKPRQTTKRSPDAQYEKTVESIEAVLADQTLSHDKKRDTLKKYKKDVDALDAEIREGFAETEAHLKKTGMSNVILQRHTAFVKEYEDCQKVVNHDLASLDDEPGFLGKIVRKFTTDRDIEKIRARIKERKLRSQHKAKSFDPNNLPFQNRKLKPKAPRMTKEAFQKGLGQTDFPKKPEVEKQLTLMDKIMDVVVPSACAATSPPTSEDLAETPDIKLTPDIIAKAAELNHDPVKIFNFIRNTIEYVPTWGSIQGAQYCLETKQGNAFDTSSLLIALLRASNIPARYVMGTIDVPIDQAMNWVGGFTDPQAALDFIASGGVPVTPVLENPNGGINPGQVGAISGIGGVAPIPDQSTGQIKFARMEHVWVEAMIKYMPSRGSKHVTGKGVTWIEFDPSFKQNNYFKGMDLTSEIIFDQNALTSELIELGTVNNEEKYTTGFDTQYIQTKLQDMKSKAESFLNKIPSTTTVGEIFGYKKIIPMECEYLLGTLPYRTVVIGAKLSYLPDKLRHKITFVINDDLHNSVGINITQSLPEIAGKKISISYSPYSSEDRDVILALIPPTQQNGETLNPEECFNNVPAYLIKVKPELRIDGMIVAQGNSVGLGADEIFTMDIYNPSTANEKIVNDIIAGEYLSVGLNTGSLSSKFISNLRDGFEKSNEFIETGKYNGISKEDMFGNLLHLTTYSYLLEVALNESVLSKQADIKQITLPSEVIFSTRLKVDKFVGIPKFVNIAGLYMDADHLSKVVKSSTGDKNEEIGFVISTGLSSSSLENSLPERIFSLNGIKIQGISAVKSLTVANNENIPIYSIDDKNIASVLPQLNVSNDVKNNISDAVRLNKTVIVPKENINCSGWTGCGYIIIDLESGAGAYLISGGLNGGFLVSDNFLTNMIKGLCFWLLEIQDDVARSPVFPNVWSGAKLFGEVLSYINLLYEIYQIWKDPITSVDKLSANIMQTTIKLMLFIAEKVIFNWFLKAFFIFEPWVLLPVLIFALADVVLSMYYATTVIIRYIRNKISYSNLAIDYAVI